MTLLHCAIGDMLNDFLRLYPRVSVELDADNRRVDVIGEGMDVALRVRFPPLEDSDLVMKTLGASHQILVATPSLLDELGRPSKPEELSRLPSLATRTRKANPQWRLLDARGEERLIVHDPRLVSDDMQALRQAALAGLGVVQLPVMAIREPLAAGALERVLPEWAPPPGVVHAVFASRRGMLPAVQATGRFSGRELRKLEIS